MRAIVTGSFDPFTLGHLEIVKRALEMFSEVYVVALVNENKQYMFTMEQKKRILELSTKELKNVVVDAFAGMTSDYMHEHKITKIVRGYRNSKDLDYEKELSQKMTQCDKNFETILLKCDEKFSEISSTSARKAIIDKDDLTNYLHIDAIQYIDTIL
ncbi:MAG: pantetheine-phosphate adenylyltransferase [Clostridia bacterium]|nr:pantetheine-phosphate adenylyltransferase [Clostridia bacterium]